MKVILVVGLVVLVSASAFGGPRKMFQGAPPVDVLLENETSTAVPVDLINPENNRTEEELVTVRDYLRQLKDRIVREAPVAAGDEPNSGKPHVAFDPETKQAPEVNRINNALSDYLYQGDVALTAEQAEHLVSQSVGRGKRQAYKDSNFPKYRWPTNAPIPYTFDSSITANVKTLIQKAIKIWTDNTCLTFKENGAGANKIRFYKGSGCWSYIGKIYYWESQDVSIGDGCEHVGIIAHEIGHALGFFHAQSRYDRDTYVTYNAANVNSGSEDQFNKETTATNDNYGVTYDYGSVMHYSDGSFAKANSGPVLVAKDTWAQKTMGQRIQPSFLDLVIMNKHYECTSKCASSATQCKNGGFPNPGKCSQCICPWGFGGALCDQRPAASNGSTTCGATLQAGADWKAFQVIIGDGSTVIKPDFTSCHWHIQAPAGKKVQFQIEYVGRVCSDGCFYGNTELKLGNFERTGYRFCCAAQATNKPVLTSLGNLAIVSMYEKYFMQQAHLKYKYV